MQVGWFAKLMVAYYFGNFEIAEGMAIRHEEANAAEWPWYSPFPILFASIGVLSNGAKAQERQEQRQGQIVLFTLFSSQGRCRKAKEDTIVDEIGQ